MMFVECENFGANPMTLAFIASIILGLLGARGLKKQIALVKEKGPASVSVVAQLTFCAMFISYLPFGWEYGRLALLVTALLRVPYYARLIPLLYQKKNGFSRTEWFLGIGLLVSLGYCIVDTGKVYMGLSLFGVVVYTNQPFKIWREGKVGSVSTTLVWTYSASAFFWTVYGFTVSDPYIWGQGFAYLAAYLTTLYLAHRYPNP